MGGADAARARHGPGPRARVRRAGRLRGHRRGVRRVARRGGGRRGTGARRSPGSRGWRAGDFFDYAAEDALLRGALTRDATPSVMMDRMTDRRSTPRTRSPPPPRCPTDCPTTRGSVRSTTAPRCWPAWPSTAPRWTPSRRTPSRADGREHARRARARGAPAAPVADGVLQPVELRLHARPRGRRGRRSRPLLAAHHDAIYLDARLFARVEALQPTRTTSSSPTRRGCCTARARVRPLGRRPRRGGAGPAARAQRRDQRRSRPRSAAPGSPR